MYPYLELLFTNLYEQCGVAHSNIILDKIFDFLLISEHRYEIDDVFKNIIRERLMHNEDIHIIKQLLLQENNYECFQYPKFKGYDLDINDMYYLAKKRINQITKKLYNTKL